MRNTLLTFCSKIDHLNESVAKVAGLLVFPLTFLVAFDVILRYVFNAPTIWVWDINVQLLGALIVLGGGYALLVGAHIGIDVLVEKMPSRKRAVLDLCTYVLFLIAVGVLLWYTTWAALSSVLSLERFNSYFRPPIYPLKVVIFIGVLLLWLQGLAKFLRLFFMVTSPKPEGA